MLAATVAQANSAASTAENSGGLERIVVTAQRRSENVQNVPIAISAFTAETLQSRILVDVACDRQSSSGVNLDAGAPFSGDRSVLSASIRGIGQDDFRLQLEPGVGVLPRRRVLGAHHRRKPEFARRDRIEIEKGPQGNPVRANTDRAARSAS